MTDIATPPDSFGSLLRGWRRRRRMSQLSLAHEIDVSSRHISFLESGRASPSRAMVQRLCEGLDVPVPDRNSLLDRAGFAPAYRRRQFEAGELAPAREAFERLMRNHEPYPALLIDRHWNVIKTNASGALFIDGADPEATPNLVDLTLDTPALRERILNWSDMAGAMLTRLRAESRNAGGDPALDGFARRIAATLPAGQSAEPVPDMPVLTVHYRLDGVDIRLFSAVMEISSALDIALNDLRLELFFPADAETRALFDAMSGPS